MENVQARRTGEDGGQEVLVKWKGYNETSWVPLASNPELAAFLHLNRGNPAAAILVKSDLRLTSAQNPAPSSRGYLTFWGS